MNLKLLFVGLFLLGISCSSVFKYDGGVQAQITNSPTTLIDSTKAPTVNVTKSPTKKPTNAPTQLVLKWDAWLTLSLIILGGIVLVRNWAPADMVFLGVVCILNLAGVITTREATAGFASSGVLTVGILMVCAAGLTNTGALGYFMAKLLGSPKTTKRGLIHLLVPMAICSSFINDTPVFLMFVPIFQAWAPKIKADVRQFYAPMSFTVLLGGTVTLIGTSTNLVVAGKAQEVFPNYPIPLFGISPVGVPVLLFGLMYIFAFADRLLPKDSPELLRQKEQDKAGGFSLSSMTLKCQIQISSRVIGKSIREANLRNLTDLYLVAVTRDDLTVHAVEPTFVLKADDELSFTGSPEHFMNICQEYGFTPLTSEGYSPADEESIMDEQKTANAREKLTQNSIVSVIIREGATIAGHTPKEIGFRGAFGASIISIERTGKNLTESLGQETLQVGDVLALLVSSEFNPNAENTEKEMKVLQKGLNTRGILPYIVGAKVISNPRLKLAKSLNGISIDKAGLRGLPGAFLIGVTKKSTGIVYRAVGPELILEEGDICWFSGAKDCIITVRRLPGLELLHEDQAKKLKARSEQRKLIEVAIAPSSSMIGSTIKELKFRSRFGAAVVAIRRSTVHDTLQPIGEMQLQIGDVLLLDAGNDFAAQHAEDPNFLLMDEVEKSTPPQFAKFYFALACCITMFGVFIGTSTQVSLIPLGLACSGLMLLARVMTAKQARAAVDWEVLVTIAAAFGVSTAMEKTKLAQMIGSQLVQLAVQTNTGEGGIIAAIYIATMLISLFVANNAAVLLMFGISATAGIQYGIDPYKIFYTLMLAGSASFLIPYGYQTNIMCLSLGPYTTKEFVKFGFPLQVLLTPISIVLVVYMEQWYIGFVVSFVLFIATVIGLYMIKPAHQIDNGTGIGDKSGPPSVHERESIDQKEEKNDSASSFTTLNRV